MKISVIIIYTLFILTQASTYEKEKWFEEIIEYYEEVIYEYDDPDELSLGQQMDLEQLIENYDLSDYCYEEIISVYEYASEEQQKPKKKKPIKQQEDENNFQVHSLSEEEYIQIIDDDKLSGIDELMEETFKHNSQQAMEEAVNIEDNQEITQITEKPQKQLKKQKNNKNKSKKKKSNKHKHKNHKK